MTEEIWRPIVGYEGLYEVSSYGRVRSLDRYDNKNHFRKGLIMKQNDSGNGRGYMSVILCLNGKIKKYLVHRLVAQAFIPNPDNLPEVNHKDENPGNNNVTNLEWCDHSYNINYGTRKDKVRESQLKSGFWTGLSYKEYYRKYWKEHRDHINEWRREYRRKRKAGL